MKKRFSSLISASSHPLPKTPFQELTDSLASQKIAIAEKSLRFQTATCKIAGFTAEIAEKIAGKSLRFLLARNKNRSVSVAWDAKTDRLERTDADPRWPVSIHWLSSQELSSSAPMKVGWSSYPPLGRVSPCGRRIVHRCLDTPMYY